MNDLATLFSRDPLLLTKDDLTLIVEEMRKSRHAFSLGNVRAGSTKPLTEKQKAARDLAASLKISI